MVVLTPEAKRIKERFIDPAFENGVAKSIAAIKMLNRGCSFDDTSKATGLTVEEVSEIANSL